ncbi:MAG: squalene/phytoene synthase family protein [Luteolibacter sp.]
MLKGVSRSFYITLRLLPLPMRRGASLGYLLARTSDTLADTASAPVDARLTCLDQFRRAITNHSDPPRWPVSMLNALSDSRERQLLECTGTVFEWLGKTPDSEAALVREVLAIITGGQMLDLERFATGSRAHPIALPDDAALEDYAWRVAGCVGEFWTKLGLLTLGNRFSNASESELLALGRDYGKGLQLVNILRDLPADLEAGRCYLPVADPMDREALLACHRQWLVRARLWIGEGKTYAATLKSRRLRAATVLPALLAEKTFDSLTDASWDDLREKIKIPRKVVYQSLARAFF